jgi:adenylate cyclase
MQAVTFQEKFLGEVHVGVSVDFIRRIIREERSSVILIALGIMMLGFLTALFLGVRLSRPISNLLQATEEISRGNYHYKLSLDRKDELGNLTKAFNRMGEELWKDTLVQKSFGKYVGSEVVDMIMADPEKIWLRGHRNQATIFFADIRGFTHYSDLKDPEEVVEKLNEYFDITTKAIVQFGGYVDKFIGDAVLGVFGVPVYYQDHLERAVRAAIYLQYKLKDIQKSGNPLLGKIGVGIDTGLIVSGNIGSQVKMEYTVIGDCVNVASRLNGLAGPGEIIISNSVHDQLGGLFEVEELPPQEIKGKPDPMKIFRIASERK